MRNMNSAQNRILPLFEDSSGMEEQQHVEMPEVRPHF